MKKERYDHTAIEKASQEKWETLKLFETDLTNSSKDPYYLLFEFPYPSGDLHIGHWYAYAITDIFARMRRMQGYNVLFPIGFDSFGLPAENAAIKNNVDPKEWTYQNIERMRTQIRSIGASLDWSKEVVTSDASYYQWTQWLFGKFFEQNLAYRAEAAVKWCPKDKTVLANEQVIDGKCERCDSEVEEKKLTQWFMKITDYAERLLTDLDTLSWPEEIKQAQRAWIGKSEGAKLRFAIAGHDEKIEVFTTRPDTVYGATYVVLAPEHSLVDRITPAITNADEVGQYVASTSRKTERERSENKEKTGVRLEGVMAINPATKEEVPIYVADYVLASYGTGAVMAVPAHDERDFEFAEKFQLSLREVILRTDGVFREPLGNPHYKPYTGDGELVNSGNFDGSNSREAMKDIVEVVGGEMTTNYRIRDWLISRQRYWGCPIPIVYDPEDRAHLVPEEHLPWLLPEDVDFNTASNNGSPLASSQELHERVTRIFGEGWTPEYDTLDTFVDSSWYFLRYLDAKDTHNFTDLELVKKWMPVDRYSGGSEHTTMHLLYARFFYKALYDLALVPTPEPFTERFNRGLIMGPDGQKMSKRWGNIVNPDEMLEKYGADAVRMYLAFVGPYNEPGHYPWKLDGVEGMRRFLDRIYRMSESLTLTQISLEEQKCLAKAADKVTKDGERFKFNTALSALMVCLNDLSVLPQCSKEAYTEFLKLLAPYAPHLCEHLWEKMGGDGSVHTALWPQYDAALLASDTITITVQVNGKRKGSIVLPKNTGEEDALVAAKELPAVQELFQTEPSPRVVYVPGRILNLVTPG